MVIHFTLILVWHRLHARISARCNEGSLFGGMYNTTPLLVIMKNILNIALLIVLLAIGQWLQKSENINKASEYFILLFSTLIGMDFMISSGDFLMFYIGLELATIPATVLVAFDKSRNTQCRSRYKIYFFLRSFIRNPVTWDYPLFTEQPVPFILLMWLPPLEAAACNCLGLSFSCRAWDLKYRWFLFISGQLMYMKVHR